MPDSTWIALVVAAGAAVAGFAQGVSGFAFSSIALSIWAWALAPQQAAPLAVFGALLGQIASLASVRGGFDLRKIWPLVVGGWLGVPLGVLLLHNADPTRYRLAIGALLTLYALYALLIRDPPIVKRGGRGLNAAFGLIGGVLGGLGGMSGLMPAIWTQARGWKRDLRRATMQVYNIAMHTFTILIYWRTGALAHADLSLFAIAAPSMLIPAVIGARLYRGFSEKAFAQVVLALLLVSGLALVYGASRKLWG